MKNHATSRRRVTVLGHLGLHPDTVAPHPGRRLLAFLAVHDEPVTRPLAAGRLWPDVPEPHARANLRRALCQVPPGWVMALDGEIGIDASVDLATARALATRCLCGNAVDLREVTTLSQDVLPGWHEDWALSARESFHMLRVQALEAACRTMARTGEHTLAVLAGAAAVAAEPLCESAAEALIEAHLQQGNRYAALHCFRALARELETELGVSPDPGLAARIAGLVPAVSAVGHRINGDRQG